MTAALKARAKRSKSVAIAGYVLRDLQARAAARRGIPPSTSGSTHAPFSLAESLDYIDAVFGDYLTYGGLSPESLAGRRVLELGPGDNYGVALRFLACGAERVVTVDRFATRRDEAQQRRIYEALLERLPGGEGERAREAVDLSAGGVSFDPERLQPIEGVAVEDLAERLPGEQFDLIVSRAVLEHLYDLDAAFGSIDALLAPGGLTLHKVDLRDHGTFTDGGMHPLTFLTLSDRLWVLMSRHSGRPNRRLADWYRDKLEELGYDARLLVTRAVGRSEELVPHVEWSAWRPEDDRGALELVRSARPCLAARFASLPAADLAAAGIFVVARKPGHP